MDKDCFFIRDFEVEIETLLHICDRKQSHEAEYYEVGPVVFDYIKGHYYCHRCMIIFKPIDIWEDTHGTGYEGHA